MPIQVNGKEARAGLALSGGGFRAAVYHLGVFRQLADWGLLWDIDVVTSVSGGSIAGAFISLHWGDDNALDALEDYLTNKSINKSAVVIGAISPFESRTDAMANALDRDLFGGATLADLSHGPRSYIGAANLSTGNLFSFISGGGKAPMLGEYDLGFQTCNAGKFRLADAVAASAAYAPIFSPFRIDQHQYQNEMEFVTLADGGFYDNLAVTPLLDHVEFDHQNCVDYAIVSDAGKPFGVDETPTESSFMTVRRTLEIMAEQIRNLQFDRLLSRHKAAVGPKPIWFSIDSTVGCAMETDPLVCSSVPSDLSEIEIEMSLVLQRHSRSLMQHRFENYAPEIAITYPDSVAATANTGT